MLTSPKLRDPFQIVRIGAFSVAGPALSPSARSSVYAAPVRGEWRLLSQPRSGSHGADDRAALARRGRSRGTKPAYLVEGAGGVARGLAGPRRPRRVDEIANGLLALGVRKGDAFAILGSHDPRVGALRLRARPDRRGRRGDLPEQLAPRLRVHPRALGGGRRPRRGRGAAREGRTTSGLRARAHVRASSTTLRERGREHAAAHPDALAEAEAAVGEDDLFTFIYTSGTTGPPKACMIRHRNYYEMPRCVEEIEDFAGRTTRCCSTCRSRTTSGG